MKKTEFSKKLLIFASVLAVAVTCFAFLLMWRTGDTSALMYLVPAVFGELATGTGFYYWKARTENKIKLYKYYGKDVYDATVKDEKKEEENYYDNIP